MDKDLSGDTLKLVRYKILFVKRDYEHAFPEQEALVSDNLDGASFATCKVAEFIQSLRTKEISVPDHWIDYPPRDRDKSGNPLYRDDKTLYGFPEEDKQYLRVYYEVLGRYPREKLKYEEEQMEVLKKIRNKI